MNPGAFAFDLQQGAATNAQRDDLQADMQAGFARLENGLDRMNERLEDGLDRMNGRLDRIEDPPAGPRRPPERRAFCKVDQRLGETLERAILPSPADD